MVGFKVIHGNFSEGYGMGWCSRVMVVMIIQRAITICIVGIRVLGFTIVKGEFSVRGYKGRKA